MSAMQPSRPLPRAGRAARRRPTLRSRPPIARSPSATTPTQPAATRSASWPSRRRTGCCRIRCCAAGVGRHTRPGRSCARNAARLPGAPCGVRALDARATPAPYRARRTDARMPTRRGHGDEADPTPPAPAGRAARAPYTWSASEVPWWEEGTAARGKKRAQSRRRRAARRRQAAPTRAPRTPRARPRAHDTPHDIDVYSRSSGAAWSMAARAYFRADEADLPRRGSFQYQGTQVVTGGEARKRAEAEARRRRPRRSRLRARAAAAPEPPPQPAVRPRRARDARAPASRATPVSVGRARDSAGQRLRAQHCADCSRSACVSARRPALPRSPVLTSASAGTTPRTGSSTRRAPPAVSTHRSSWIQAGSDRGRSCSASLAAPRVAYSVPSERPRGMLPGRSTRPSPPRARHAPGRCAHRRGLRLAAGVMLGAIRLVRGIAKARASGPAAAR